MNVHIIHHNDLDGICAAAIVNKYYDGDAPASGPRIFFHETNYNRPIPIENMNPGDVVWIVDFSYPPEEMAKIADAIQIDKGHDVIDQVIWIDHHKTAAAYGYSFSRGLRDFTDKGLSGCELTWRYCFPDLDIPVAVSLIGDYDSWRLQLPSSNVFHEGAKLELLNPLAPLWDELLKNNEVIVKVICGWGQTVTRYRDNYTSMIRKSYGYETSIDGHRAYAMNLYGFGSQQFGELFNQYPVVIAYVHDGQKFTVSLYSETVDVGQIAKALGGGGHKGAAGFVCQELPFFPTGDNTGSVRPSSMPKGN